MTIVIFGQKWLAREVLRGLVTMPLVEVVSVCPDVGSDNATDSFSVAARSIWIPVLNPNDIQACDLGLAAYCQRYIPDHIRARCGLGILSYHPSLLPRHRGRDAVRWTVAMRDPVAGGTVYWMDDGADTGPIEAQDWCHVLPGETASELWQRSLAPMGVRLLTNAVARLAQGIPPNNTAQDERAATFEPAFARNRLCGAS